MRLFTIIWMVAHLYVFIDNSLNGCASLCIHVRICVHIYVWLNNCMYPLLSTYAWLNIFIYMRGRASLYICMAEHVYEYMYACASLYICMTEHLYVYMYDRTTLCIYACLCISMYMYGWTFLCINVWLTISICICMAEHLNIQVWLCISIFIQQSVGCARRFVDDFTRCRSEWQSIDQEPCSDVDVTQLPIACSRSRLHPWVGDSFLLTP